MKEGIFAGKLNYYTLVNDEGGRPSNSDRSFDVAVAST